jgi:hypothetical protein
MKKLKISSETFNNIIFFTHPIVVILTVGYLAYLVGKFVVKEFVFRKNRLPTDQDIITVIPKELVDKGWLLNHIIN